MCTKHGTFMIADSLITEYFEDGTSKPCYNTEKIFVLPNSKTAISFWGAVNNPKTKFDLFSELDLIKKELSPFTERYGIATITDKLLKMLPKLNIDQDDELGFHVTGYDHHTPRLNHVFHAKFLEKREFINEDATCQAHEGFIGRHGYKKISFSMPFPMLFNGDLRSPSIILKGLSAFGDYVDYENLTKERAKEFLIFLMDFAIGLQNFSEDSRTKGALIGYPLSFVELIDGSSPSISFISQPTTVSKSRFFTSFGDAVKDSGGKPKDVQ